MRHRGWPASELASGILTKPINELDAEREAVRNRLLGELPDPARELLYRLTLVAGRFDRALALAVADIEPSIERPGEAYELLVGPWIESRGARHHSVSPLLSNAGDSILSGAQSDALHRAIVDHLLSRQPFPGDFFSHLLVHGLKSNHSEGLLWLAYAVLLCPHEDRQRIADALFLLPLVGQPDKPLYPDNPLVSASLRLAQFCIVTWLGDNEKVPVILDRLFEESRLLKPEVGSTTFLGLAISNVLLHRPLPVSPARWMPWLEELVSLVHKDETLQKGFKDSASHLTYFEGSFDQFFFVLHATSLSGIGYLSDLFDLLNRTAAARRQHYLSALSSPYLGVHAMISAAWLSDHQNGTLDGREAANTDHRLAGIARTWTNEDIEVECICAEAIMLDEYADDSENALTVLDDAQKCYPYDPRVARQKAKILFRQGDHTASLEAVEGIVDAIGKNEPIERAYTLREAAISAAETGRYSRSSELFSDAYDAAEEAGKRLLPMAVGLQADKAVVQLREGCDTEAVASAAAALREAEGIEPTAGHRHKACLSLLGHTILWLLQQRNERGGNLGIVYGCCSNPEPHRELRERDPQSVSGGEKIGHKGRCSAVLWQSKTRPAAGVPQNSPGVFCGMWEGCIPWSCTGVSGGRFLSKGSAGGRRRDDSV